MGYYTRYKLTVDTPHIQPNGVYESRSSRPEDIIVDFVSTCDGAGYALNDDGSSSDESKWYTHCEDLALFSKNYPAAVFTLTGEGEESGDLWRLYVKNGQSTKSKAVLTYEPCPYKAGE